MNKIKINKTDRFKIWDNMAKSFHFVSSNSKAHKDKYLKVAEIILSEKAKNVLDLGCGTGILEKELIDRGFSGEVRAFDASEPMLDIAKTVASKDSIVFEQKDLDDGFPMDKKFEIITSINLIFFLKDKQKFLNEVSNHLKDKKSIFILISPRPSDEASNWEFVKEHYRNTDLFEKVLITLNELLNVPSYISLALRQRKLFQMEKAGEIKIHKKEEIIEMAEKAKLDIIKVEDIHAKQNWLFVMRRV